jgi:UV DNA damage endonuclease
MAKARTALPTASYPPGPKLGLVCQTLDNRVRYRTVTRARFLTLSAASQRDCLRDLYADNLQRLFNAVRFCAEQKIHLYRVLCGLFPLNDEPAGEEILAEFAPAAAAFAAHAEKHRVRVLMHPDQFVVLNSERPSVIQQSIHILSRHARVFDLLGLPRSAWSPLLIHGGKGGRAAELEEVIRDLPPGIATRLALENDERAYSAVEIVRLCERAQVPMVFDPHHHVVHGKLDTYEHPSVREAVEAARGTWSRPEWQVAHISNGATAFADPRHSDLITDFPSALWKVPWVEVEAKSKDEAIRQMRLKWPALR